MFIVGLPEWRDEHGLHLQWTLVQPKIAAIKDHLTSGLVKFAKQPLSDLSF